MSQQQKVPLHKRLAMIAVLALVAAVPTSALVWFNKQPPVTDLRALCESVDGVYFARRATTPVCVRSDATIDMTSW